MADTETLQHGDEADAVNSSEPHKKALQLVQAVREGNLQTVRDLVESGADVNYFLVENEYYSTRPLFEACKEGQFEIVRYLVEQGADMNLDQGLDTCTCLMAACVALGTPMGVSAFEKRFADKSAQERSEKVNQFLSIVRLLIEKGADVNNVISYGRTPLRFAAYSNHALPIFIFLLEHGACFDGESKGIPPGKIVEIIAKNSSCPAVIEYMTTMPDCSHAQRIDALLLSAARELAPGCSDDDDDRQPAIMVWKQALEEVERERRVQEKKKLTSTDEGGDHERRTESNESTVAKVIRAPAAEESVSIAEDTGREETSPAVGAEFSAVDADSAQVAEDSDPWCPPPVEPVAAYNYAVEVRTVAELDALSEEDLRTQALLVLERVSGPDSDLLLNKLQNAGGYYELHGQVNRAMAVWLHAIDLMQRHLEPLHFYFKYCFKYFLELFLGLLFAADEKKSGSMPPEQILPERMFAYLLTVLDKIAVELERGAAIERTTEAAGFSYKKLPRVVVQLLMLMQRAVSIQLDSGVPSLSDNAQEAMQRFKSQLRHFIQKNPRNKRRRTLLHHACDDSLATEFEEDCPCSFIRDKDVIQTLLECGSDVNAVDRERNTPLHVAAMSCAEASKKPEEAEIDAAEKAEKVPEEKNAEKVEPLCEEAKKAAEAHRLAKVAHCVQVMRVLVQHGAKLDAENEAGQTAAQLLEGVEGLRELAGMSGLEELYKMMGLGEVLSGE